MAKESTFEFPPRGHIGVLGYDSVDDDFPTVLVDSDGHPQVDIIDSGGADLKDILDKLADILTELNAKLETADLASDTTRYINVLQQQYTGAAWVKSNLLWGYNDALHDQAIDNNVSAGTDSVDGSAVPANELWVVQRIISHWAGTSCTKTLVILVSDSTQHVLDADFSPASGVYLITEGPLVMKEGDFLRLTGEGLTAGDDLRIYWHGYKMDIDM